MTLKQIVLTDCGKVGWLGMYMLDGRELYRTGAHQCDEFAAMLRVIEWAADNEANEDITEAANA